MRLNHLLSKEVVCGGGFLAVDLARAVEWAWAGQGLALAERWTAGRVSWDVFSRVWLACPCWCRRHTLCCLCLVVVGASVRALVRVGVACCRGSGAVRPGCLTRVLLPCVGGGAGCGWVGCELYSGREHLTVRFLRQHLFVVVFCCLFF